MAAVTARTDSRKLFRRITGWNRLRPRGRAAEVKARAAVAVDRMVTTAPRDTQRYVRGWALAGRTAGVYRGGIPAVRKTTRFTQYLRRLERQAGYFEDLIDHWYGGDPPTNRRADKTFRKLVRLRDKAVNELQKFRSSGGTAILIGGRKRKGGGSGLDTVRDKVYGGTGRMVHTANATYAVLHNLEAHATIVEKRVKVVRNALAGLGLKRVGRKYLQEIERAPKG